ncbi:hypothetical protein FNJ62_21650 [Streptomyces benahoarensis]|uniref:Extracellular solute-binding protein n=1 Tax=Streptomyces benahoarensis TaxID=2595054 RepID=A0A553ZA11_9ACTN|nr:hypothetical protein FNJ62_21650 [Streptomyces benahoarensis]TSB38271.1 hypothetical protein FNZ23_17360 [Streptomyces benahoarensis]
MYLSARPAAAGVALVLTALTATACAPSTSGGAAGGESRTGTLRVWLFREVGNAPKEKVVRQAVADFTAAHQGVKVTVDYIPVDTRAQRVEADRRRRGARRDGIRRRLQPPGRRLRQGQGRVRVVPLPGRKKGEIAPAFAGGNNIGVLRSTGHRTLAVDLTKRLAGKEAQRGLFDAMGFLPTFADVRAEAAKRRPYVKPFVHTLDAGAEFVPVTPGWATVDASLVLPTMYQQIVSGRKSVDAAAAEAARAMDGAFHK